MENDKEAMNFWGRVELAQIEANIPTLKQLCENTGILYQSMANKRSLGRLPNLVTAVRIAKQVGKPVEWLLYGDQKVDGESRKAILKAIDGNERFFDMAKAITTASQSQLFAVEVLLRIRD